jgi:hypothetical protein
MGRWKFSLTFGAFWLCWASFAEARASQASLSELDSQLCQSPWETVCEAPVRLRAPGRPFSEIKDEVRRKVLKRIQWPAAQGGCALKASPDLVSRYQGAGRSTEETYFLALMDVVHSRGQEGALFCLARVAESEVFRALGPEWNPARIQKIYAQVRETLQAEVLAELAGKGKVELGAEMSAILGKTQLVLASGLRELVLLNSPQVPGTRADFSALMAYSNETRGICGTEFLDRNLSASSSGYYEERSGVPIHTGLFAVVGCPGQWLELADSRYAGNPEARLAQVLGHELGHMIHVSRNRPALGVVELKSDGTRVPMTFNATPAYDEYLRCANENYASVMPQVPRVAGGNFRQKRLGLALGHEPTSVELRADELVADEWGNRVLARFLEKSGSESRPTLVRSALERLCRDAYGAPYEEFGEEHPSGRFRVEQALRSPRIRAALSCEDPAPRYVQHPSLPYCAL